MSVPVKMKEVQTGRIQQPTSRAPTLAGAASSLAIVAVCGGLIYWGVARWNRPIPRPGSPFRAQLPIPSASQQPVIVLQTTRAAGDPSAAGHQGQSASAVFASAARSVVLVTALGPGGQRQGSGVVLGPEQVVTNNHVVAGATQLAVSTTADALTATLLRADTARDLAILRVPGLSLPTPATRKGAGLTVGERVYAIGAPKGLALTLSEGLVSGLRAYKGGTAVQTTAAISPGSSGGGLFDSEGRLVGITTFGLDGDSLNFALPAEWAVDLSSGTASLNAPMPPQPVLADVAPSQPRPSEESDTERVRRLGTVEFEREMHILEAKADQADIAWERYLAGCRVNVTTASAGAVVGGRNWFAYAYSSVTTSQVTDACAEAGTFYSLHQQVKDGMCVAEDRARRASIYPGTRREIRYRYRLDWDGWDRVCRN